jgi:hypothetical protein
VVLQPLKRNASRLTRNRFGLFPFRSPLLRESIFLYFPLGTEMFQFPNLPSSALCVQAVIPVDENWWVSPFGHPRVIACSAAHRGFSQPATSFIGVQCQGIHRVPLIHLKQENTKFASWKYEYALCTNARGDSYYEPSYGFQGPAGGSSTRGVPRTWSLRTEQ